MYVSACGVLDRSQLFLIQWQGDRGPPGGLVKQCPPIPEDRLKILARSSMIEKMPYLTFLLEKCKLYHDTISLVKWQILDGKSPLLAGDTRALSVAAEIATTFRRKN